MDRVQGVGREEKSILTEQTPLAEVQRCRGGDFHEIVLRTVDTDIVSAGLTKKKCNFLVD